MIDAEVKSIHWTDTVPKDPDEPLLLAVTAIIGEREKDAADCFQVLVCNVAWLGVETVARNGVWPRGMLVVNSFDPNHVRKTLQSLADSFRQSDNWRDFSERMNRYLLWEYEDYDRPFGAPVVS